MWFKKAIFPILLLLVLPLNGQSWIGYKYSGGLPTHRLFGRPIEYCNGINLEHFSTNFFGDESEKHDWRFGIQGEVLFGNGIRQSVYLPAVSPSEQQVELNRVALGGSLCTRYTYLETTLQPYGEFAVGLRNFNTTLNITPGTVNSGPLEFTANNTYVNYCLSSGFVVPISKSVRLDFGINYNIGKKADLYDFNSVFANGSSIDANTVQVGTSSLQFEFGILINYQRSYYNSFFGNGSGLLDFLFF